VHVFSQVVGFKKIKFFTNENVGAGDLQLPQYEMHSTAFWISIKKECMESISISSEEKVEAIAGISYLMRHVSAVILMCDVKDIGIVVEDNLTRSEIHVNARQKMRSDNIKNLNQFEPNIYIYDKFPNGIGFSEVLYEKASMVLEKVLEVICACPCSRGCPSCIGPSSRAQGNHKEVAQMIISKLLDKVYH